LLSKGGKATVLRFFRVPGTSEGTSGKDGDIKKRREMHPREQLTVGGRERKTTQDEPTRADFASEFADSQL